ncbi:MULTISPECIES: AAA family ATPase [unclassified Pseudomonas]|uniref:AAA family ATPase n=1 Tax=unclassified Pseudomonas TaxID=196821 RepID=UPI00147594F7|nr:MULTISPECIES: AAA family ATPase [unclassified Pseudomonas]NMY38171.1 ATP-binding protein [Pseudomonas sp. WS 5078]NMY61087.1 ATP-binding protein [Pseudomonas sp. WS 5354]
MPKVADIAETNPIIKKFEIIGLNGFKNLALNTPTCVRIVVAENGTGKTTLLNALYAVLTRRLSKLHQIKFSKIIIQFEGYEKFEFERAEIFPTELKPLNSSAFAEITEYGVTEEELYEFYSEIGPNFDPRKTRTHEVFRKVYANGPYDPSESTRLLRRAMPALERTQVYTGLTSYITKAMGDLEVLYLPTFRRIEVEFNKYEKSKARHHSLFETVQPEKEDNDETLMWFGMGDVEAQLDHIKSTIQSETFTAYSRLSVQSLEDLLSPDTKTPEPIPSDNKSLGDQLRLVLARLGQAEGQAGARILELIETEEINGHAFDSLRSYLFQMLEIYKSTQKDEQSIEGFVKVINKYWVASAFESSSQAEKAFIFDKMSLDIDIRTPYSSNPVKLAQLSSGEKQIVSIFAKLHLQKEKKFIVLIDEPELSLSMAWQRLFLLDILESPSCAQLIAITHSPFIFENELDDYAQPLYVTYERIDA